MTLRGEENPELHVESGAPGVMTRQVARATSVLGSPLKFRSHKQVRCAFSSVLEYGVCHLNIPYHNHVGASCM